jgi:predicted O-methyltransferase YrrM
VRSLTFDAGNSSDIIPDLRNRFPEISSFDFIYINHDKTKYLHDLLLLESLGFLKPGTRVVADHVRLFRVYEYLVHVRDKTLYSSSEFRKALLAYDKPQAEHLYDGM